MVHDYNFSIWEVEAGGPEVKGHPWLHRLAWRYMRTCLKQTANKQETSHSWAEGIGEGRIFEYLVPSMNGTLCLIPFKIKTVVRIKVYKVSSQHCKTLINVSHSY